MADQGGGVSYNTLQQTQQIRRSPTLYAQMISSGGRNRNRSGGDGGGGGGGGDGGLGAALQGLLQAIAGGNQKELDEKIREFNQTFGLDQEKFAFDKQKWDQTFGLEKEKFGFDKQKWADELGLKSAELTGYYTPQSAWQAPTQDQYVRARTQQLQSQFGFDPTRAGQTAQAEWAQGNAQTGNVAGGLPAGISFTAPASAQIPTLARQRMEAELSGMYNGAPTETAREFQARLGEQQRQFNIDTQRNFADLASRLSGPADYFKYLNATNAGQNILGNLRTGQPMGAGAPVGNTGPQTLQNILNQLGAGGQQAGGGGDWRTGGYAPGENTNTGSGIKLPYGMGELPYMHQIQPTAWNNMSEGARQFMGSAYAAAGYDPNDVWRSIQYETPASRQAPRNSYATFRSPAGQSIFG